MSMSVEQSEFIRKLKITLISVLGPFIIVGLVTSVINHQRIGSNEKHIEALESSRVSREVMLLYINELRTTNNLLRQDMEGQCDNAKDQISQLNERLDDVIKEIYQVKKRGLPEGYQH